MTARPAHNPPPNFDHLAHPYRWLEFLTFGPLLQRTRTHFLPHLKDCRQALILGDGDGRFTAQLLNRCPSLHVHAIDASPAMLQLLGCNSRAHQHRLTTETADLRLWQPGPGARYDLIATHFFLDCLTTDEVHTLARRLLPAVTPGALWLVSDFAIPSSPLRPVAAALVAALYFAFRLLTGLRTRHLPDHANALRSAGWRLQSQSTPLGGLLVSQLWVHAGPSASGLRNKNAAHENATR